MSKQQIGRLALRQEGESWNAYYAKPETMDGAILLGSIRLALVASEDRKTAFMDLMRDCVSDIIHQATGIEPTWPTGPQPAPQHEKAGNA